MVVKAEKPLIEKIELLRKEIEALRGSEEKYKAFVAASQDAIVEVDEKGRIILWNKGAEQIFGYSAEEILGQPVAKLMAEKHRERHRKGFESFLNGDRKVKSFVEGKGLRKDGSTFPIEWSLSSWQENGETIVMASGRDLSERKQVEELLELERRRLSMLLETFPGYIYLQSPDHSVHYANQYFVDHFGEPKGRLCYEVLWGRKEPCEVCPTFEVFNTKTPQVWEWSQTPDGRIYAIYDYPFVDSDGSELVLEIGVDITERKQAEEALRESQERYIRLYEGINEAVALFTVPDLRISHWNKRFEDLYKQMIAKNIEDITIADIAPTVEPDDWGMAMEIWDKVVAGEPMQETYTLEVKMKDLEGKRRVVEVKSSLYREKDQIVGVQLAITDITERKRAEEALRESEERYSQLYEGINEAVALFSLPDLRISHWNRRFEEYAKLMYAKDIEDISATDIAPTVEADDWDMAMEMLGEVLAGKPVPDIYELSVKNLKGNRRVIEVKPSFFKEKGQVVGVQVAVTDITERKQAEQKLRESEERYSQLYKGINEAVALFRLPDLKVSYWNKRFEEYARQMYGKNAEDITATEIPPSIETEDWDRAMEALAKTLAGEPVPDAYELRMKDVEGKRRVIEAKPSFYKEKDQVVGIQVMISDITERKQAEEALRESEERYRAIFERAADSIVLVDAETGALVDFNDRAHENLGYERQELEKLKIPNFEIIESAKEVERHIEKIVREGAERFETKHRTKSGEIRDIEVNSKAISIGGRNFVQSIWRDITERKQAEEALRQSEEKYRALFDSTVVGTFVIDAETMKVVLVNQAAAEAFGFNSVEEALGVNPLDFILPDDRERALKIIVKDMFEEDLRQTNEFRAVTKDGREIWISAMGTRIMHQGRLAGLISFTDITERKNAEDRLKSSFIDLAETISRALESRDPYTAGHQRGVAKLAHLVGEKMGLDEDRLQGLYIGGLLHDIGKISIPASILTKLGKLSDEEWALIHAHPKQGYTILKDSKLPRPVIEMTLHHHERLDGSGYPNGISGDELGLEVRILAVCDVVEAMSSHRPYRPARTVKEVLEEINNGRGTKYDASVVDVVVQILESGEFNFA
jgi:PAS domain S-box-containing protein